MPKTTAWTEWNPPDPASLDAGSRDGQKLLALVKAMEKESDAIEFDKKFEETLLLMKSLISIYARHGLLRGNYQKAEQIMASSSANNGDKSNSNNHHQQGGGSSKSKNKRNRRKEDKKSEEKSLIESVSTDESLVMSALLRIFGLQGEKLHSMMPFVMLAADICTSISNNLKAMPYLPNSTIGLAEYELIASLGVPLLRGLSKMISSLLLAVSCQSEDATKKIQIHLNNPSLDDDVMDGVAAALQSCLRASAALVGLFGTKLSRSTGLMSDLQNIAWSALTLPNNGIQSASARLLATLPLAGAASSGGGGGRNNNPTSILTTSEQWGNSLMEAVVALSTILKTMAPVSQKMAPENQSGALTGCISTVVEEATAFFQKNLASDETLRVSAFRVLVNGFSSLIVAMLSRDHHGPGNEMSLLDTRLCLDDILNLLETMLSFPAASESLFYITKKRLRQENVDGGVLSPTALASELANYIKLSGHRIMNTLFSAVGSPVLLPYAKRIQRMVSAVLFTSCSGPLRKVVDAVSTSQLEGTKRRWLHTSISMRLESIRTFSGAISLFGLEPTRVTADGSSWVPSKKSSNMEQCITLVGGCLVEQLTWEGFDTEDWGSLAERTKLVVTAAKSLEASLSSCGGFMSLATRALIDSISTTGLQVIVSPHQNNHIGSSSQVKVAILELGSACLTTPWPNGAASSLLEQVQITAAKFTLENSVVSAVAATTLRLCDSLATPRVPALHTVTRKQDISSSKVPVSSDALIQGINSAQEQISQHREDLRSKAQEEAEQRSKRMKMSEKTKPSPETEQAATYKSTGASSTKDAGAKTIVAPLDNEDKKAAKTETSSDYMSKQEAEAHMEIAEEPSNIAKEKVDKTEGGQDEEDFLPGIIDDDGPDEEDL